MEAEVLRYTAHNTVHKSPGHPSSLDSAVDEVISWQYVEFSDSSRQYFCAGGGRTCAGIPDIIVRKYRLANRCVNIHFELKHRRFLSFYLDDPNVNKDSFRQNIEREYKFCKSQPDSDGLWELYQDLPAGSKYQFYTCRPVVQDGRKMFRVIGSHESLNKFYACKNSDLYLVVYDPEMDYGTIYGMAGIYAYYKDKEYLLE